VRTDELIRRIAGVDRGFLDAVEAGGYVTPAHMEAAPLVERERPEQGAGDRPLPGTRSGSRIRIPESAGGPVLRALPVRLEMIEKGERMKVTIEYCTA
jgi:hypothetical protein